MTSPQTPAGRPETPADRPAVHAPDPGAATSGATSSGATSSGATSSAVRTGETATRVTALLIAVLTLQTVVPPFATDMYTPAFPQVSAALQTSASMVGLTLTAFFIGMGAGQLFGGPVSDQRGRRGPLIVGGVVCLLGGIGCALAPSIGVLVACRLVQGLGGGMAASVARAVTIDLAHGRRLAQIMSIMMSLGGLAPMIAPVLGAAVVSSSGWREVFWCLTGLGALMAVTAALVVPESLPPERRHGGGLSRFASGVTEVLRRREFTGYMLTSAFSGLAMMAYIADAAYVLESMRGMAPLHYSYFFAATALGNVIVSLVNARYVAVVPVRRLVGLGVGLTFGAAVWLAVTVFWLGTALVPVCLGFFVLMGAQGLVFGNASALATAHTRHIAGAASSVMGIVQSIAMAVAAPLASAGGGRTAVPMAIVMLVGAVGSVGCYLVVARERRSPAGAANGG